MSECTLSVSTFDDFTDITITGVEPVRMDYGFNEFRNLAQLYYGAEWSDETAILSGKLVSKYLDRSILKHHGAALTLLYKGFGQYVLGEYFPKEIIQRLKALPRDSTLKLNMNEEASIFPWELMHTGSNFLCLEYVIGRIDNEPRLREPSGGRVIPLLMISDPTGDLWGAQNEANYILGQLRGSKIQANRYGSEIKKKQYIDLIQSGRYDVIHYSGHSASSLDPGKSHHMFIDGPLYGYEIEEMRGRMPFLVFSNSCQSAESSLSLEDTGNTSLAGSYLRAGVSGCIAAIWPVSDQASGIFASDFYRYILFGNTVGTSMLNSRRNAFKRWGFQDFIWGSYIYYGDPGLRIV